MDVMVLMGWNVSTDGCDFAQLRACLLNPCIQWILMFC